MTAEQDTEWYITENVGVSLTVGTGADFYITENIGFPLPEKISLGNRQYGFGVTPRPPGSVVIYQFDEGVWYITENITE